MAHPQAYIAQPSGPNLLVRLIWFVFVGWWLGLIAVWVAWALNVSIIGLPLGLWLINRLPAVITLRPPDKDWRVEGTTWHRGPAQHGLLVRAAYFILIGWWLSLVWLHLAYVVLATVLGIPLAFWMFNRVGAVTTLYRS